MTLLADLDAFYTDPTDKCGELEPGLEGAVVWFSCECGGSMARRVPEEDTPPRTGRSRRIGRRVTIRL
jgi:hypothetical protein